MGLVGGHGSGVAQPSGERMKHVQRDRLVLCKHVLELALAQHEASAGHCGLDRRAARSVFQERDLAEVIARPELPDRPFVPTNLRSSRDEDEELASALALAT